MYEEFVLNHSLFFIEFKGKEVEPNGKIGSWIEDGEVSFDDFTHGCDSVVSTMAVGLLFLTAFRDLNSF